MFDSLKNKVENQLIEDLILYSIATHQIFKSKRISTDDIIAVCTELGTISKESVNSSLKHLTKNDTIFFNNGWDIKFRTKQVERVFKEIKRDISKRQSKPEVEQE